MQTTHKSSVTTSCIDATFVTLLTGERYATAAACLPRQLRAVNTSVCSTLLCVYDDNVSLPLDALSLEYGAEQMIPLSRLKARYLARSGRRLFMSSTELQSTVHKIWLCAASSALDGSSMV